jgi:hypothetical protein
LIKLAGFPEEIYSGEFFTYLWRQNHMTNTT